VVLLLLAVLVGLPFLSGRVLAGHDIVVYLINAQQTAENIRSGELFPAWAGGFNAGFGAPTLLFFPPLTSYLHSIPVLLGVPLITGVCFWSLTGLFLSGLAMYGWLAFNGLRSGALVAAVIYMIAPYRILDLYTRSALAEHWAFVWPPLILWVATSSDLRRTTRVPILAVLVGALLMTNIPLAVLFGLGLAVWFVVSRRIGSHRLSVFGGTVLGFAMAAFALIPQALSSSLLAVDQYYGATAGRFRPSANTLFSGDVAGWDFNAQVSSIVVATFVLVVVSFVLMTPGAKLRRGARAALIGSVVCLLAATAPAAVLWETLPVVSKLQFPWRVAALLTFGLAFSSALLGRRFGWLMAVLVAATSAALVPELRTLPSSAFTVEQPEAHPPGTVFPDPRLAWEAGTGGWYWRHENLAETWFLARHSRSFLLEDLSGRPAPELDSIRRRPAAVIEDPSIPVRVVSWGSTRREIEVDLPADGTILWRAISFPGMGVQVDGRQVETFVDPTTGLVAHALPSGRHSVQWSWRPFPALRRARAVSLMACLVSFVLLGISGLTQLRRRSTSEVVIEPG
jgi:hypothetical protein